jgi:hypothetical protein
MSDATDDFKWTTDDSVVARRSDGLAVYANKFGLVVIRKEADALEDDDPVFLIEPSKVPGLIKALRKAAKDAKE